MVALPTSNPTMGAPAFTGFGNMPPSRTCSVQSLVANLWALATSYRNEPPAIQERKYAPYVPTHAGSDFANSATPRYMKELNGAA